MKITRIVIPSIYFKIIKKKSSIIFYIFQKDIEKYIKISLIEDPFALEIGILSSYTGKIIYFLYRSQKSDDYFWKFNPYTNFKEKYSMVLVKNDAASNHMGLN